MVDLREKLMIYVRSMGATEIPESTKKHFRRKIGDFLQFEDLLNHNKLFVLPKTLSKVQVAREVVTVSQQLDNRDTPSKVKEIQQIGLHIRDAVLSNNTEISWPPKPSELCENAFNLPPKVDAFLFTLLTGNTEIITEYPHHVRRLVNSFGLIGGVTNEI